jgi:hypothetical protein
MKSDRAKALAPATLAFAAMAALGWNLGSNSSAPTDSPSSQRASSGSGRPAQSARASEAASTQVRAIRDAGSPEERIRASIQLANSVPVADFPAWVEGNRFNFRAGPELNIFRMILFERWMAEDPSALIAWSGKNGGGQGLRALAHLAKNDPETLFDHYRNHPDNQAELKVLLQIAKSHPDLALKRLGELSEKGLADSNGQTKDLLTQLAKLSPSALEAVLPDLSPELDRIAESALVGQRLVKSYETEIQSLWERPDGWKIFSEQANQNDDIASRLIDGLQDLPESWKAQLANSPYGFITETSAKKWMEADLAAAGFSPSQIEMVRTSALSRLAYSDPEYALANLGPDLNARLRSNLISYSLSRARHDPEKVEKLINLLNSEDDRALARTQIELYEIASNKSAVAEPSAWLEKLSNIGADAPDTSAVLRQLNTLDKATLATVRAGFNELPPERQSAIGQLIASGHITSVSDSGFAGDALRAFVAHPPDQIQNPYKGPEIASSVYAVNLLETDAAAAAAWMNSLPDGNAKLWAQKNVAYNWNQSDPKAVKNWLNTLPPATRDEVSSYLKNPE